MKSIFAILGVTLLLGSCSLFSAPEIVDVSFEGVEDIQINSESQSVTVSSVPMDIESASVNITLDNGTEITDLEFQDGVAKQVDIPGMFGVQQWTVTIEAALGMRFSYMGVLYDLRKGIVNENGLPGPTTEELGGGAPFVALDTSQSPHLNQLIFSSVPVDIDDSEIDLDSQLVLLDIRTESTGTIHELDRTAMSLVDNFQAVNAGGEDDADYLPTFEIIQYNPEEGGIISARITGELYNTNTSEWHPLEHAFFKLTFSPASFQ